MQDFWALARSNFSQLEIYTAQSILSLLGLYACMSVFQALFDQSGSTWVVQGTEMDLKVLGWEIPPSQVNLTLTLGTW